MNRKKSEWCKIPNNTSERNVQTDASLRRRVLCKQAETCRWEVRSRLYFLFTFVSNVPAATVCRFSVSISTAEDLEKCEA